LGPWQPASAGLDLGSLAIVLEVDGQPIHTGTSAAILDHPLESLATLANMLASRGESLAEGCVVLAGAATAAVHIEVGQRVSAVVEGLGSATVRVF
jgi:2-oxo-3-hexenedioate decarboxylase